MDAFKNFAKSALSAGILSTDTTLVLVSGGGAALPAVPFNATVWNASDYADPSDDPSREIVRVTVVSADTLTVTRAQESTTAVAHNTAGKTYKLIAGLTAKTLAEIAPLASPGFTGTPAAPTAATNTNSTQLANTAFVQNQIAAQAPGVSPVQSVFGRSGIVVAGSGDYAVGQITGAAPLASPAFTGSATFAGVLYANAVNGNIRFQADGTTGSDGAVYASTDGTLYFSNWATTRGWRVNANGSIDQLGSNAPVTLGGNLSVAGASVFSGLASFNGTINASGTINANYAGANIRIKSDGTNANDGGIFAGSNGDIYLCNWGTTRGWKIYSTGEINQLGTGAVTLGGAVSIGGALNSYNGRSLVGQGVATICGRLALTGQTASNTPVVCTAPPAGLYRVSFSANTTTVGTGGTGLVEVNYTDNTGTAQNVQGITGSFNLATLGYYAAGTWIMRTNGSNISVGVVLSGVTGSPQYALYATVERLD